MNHLDYFGEQIKTSKKLTQDDLDKISKSPDYFGTIKSIGDTLFFMMVIDKETRNQELVKIFLSNIELTDDLEFVDMVGTNKNLPRFKIKETKSNENS